MKYNVIALDPPWPYERTHGQGIAEREYSLMTWADLAALGPLIAEVAAPNCGIYMWTTAPLLLKIVDMVNAWPFRYITKAFSWVKTHADGQIVFGIGSYTASNTEDMWLLSNGTPERHAKNVSQVVPTYDAVIAPRTRHSKKPEIIQDKIEQLMRGPYLEVFARRRRPGWTCIGNELDGLDIRDSLTRVAADQELPAIVPSTSQHRMFESEAA